MNARWWIPLVLVLVVGATGVMLMGIRTYQDAPPIPDFVNASGQVIVSEDQVLAGQAIFQRYGLMDYGSMFGDGASRGPDFTADALHQTAVAMAQYYAYAEPASGAALATRTDAIAARVKREIKVNAYDQAVNRTVLTDGQIHAFGALVEHYTAMFTGTGQESFRPAGYITNPSELRDLSAFFFWGAWVCGAQRPGQTYSFTHNWPYDETAGNTPSSAVLFWSVFGLFGLILALGAVLFVYGRLDQALSFLPAEQPRLLATPAAVAAFRPSPTQRATFKFFAVAAIVFLLQVLAGVLTVHDFLGFTKFFGVDLAQIVPVTISRGWHVQMSLLWIATCWIAGSIFVLPMITNEEPKNQLGLVNLLFVLLAVVVVGSVAGIFMGPMGMLGEWWRWLGNQGWEFVELGRLWQALLFVALALWVLIIARGIWPVLRGKDPLSLPYMLLYTVVTVLVLFVSGFVAGPRTNFVIADFWRWMVIHMWVESFLEVFTTIIVAYFLVLMGLVTSRSAARVVYMSTLLYLGSGILGISHNFYWNAKPVMTLAIGAIFSTLQVVPLVLLTLEAWKTRHMPDDAARESYKATGERTTFGQSAAFNFLLAVNFWNFMGAGVFGLIINLPIVNYYEHGTYLTVNHGHSAFMGVYGNLSLAALVFCARFLIPAQRWSDHLMRLAFWSINIGLALMVILDLFPAGVLQLQSVLDNGLWYARSQAFILGTPFQTLTWLRAVGGPIFVVGGVCPILFVLLTRWRWVKQASPAAVDLAAVPAVSPVA